MISTTTMTTISKVMTRVVRRLHRRKRRRVRLLLLVLVLLGRSVAAVAVDVVLVLVELLRHRRAATRKDRTVGITQKPRLVRGFCFCEDDG